MKSKLTWLALPLLLAILPTQFGCQKASAPKSVAAAAEESKTKPVPPDPCRLVLLPHYGDTALDAQIMRAQEAVSKAVSGDAALEQLGWLFVAKARASFDGGFYKLAEQCSFALENGCATNAATDAESVTARRYAAMLLRGHVLQNLHQFKAAEPLARELAEKRGSPMDFGLLGDVLMEQGRLDEAAAAYQNMMNLRPDSRALARAAHLRWLKGDLEGAIEAMREAAGTVGTRDTDSVAWMRTRLAFYEFQAGQAEIAGRACDDALSLVPDYAPALLLRGRMALANGDAAKAVAQFERAVKLNPLPEYYWALVEALQQAGQSERAELAETALARRGSDDPRTYAIYLATQRRQAELAVRLATRELGERADVFTYDCLAWAQYSAGDLVSAKAAIAKALAEGTSDARLFFHAGIINAAVGEREAAQDFFKKSFESRHLLWPSERNQLEKAMSEIAGSSQAGQKETAWLNNSAAR